MHGQHDEPGDQFRPGDLSNGHLDMGDLDLLGLD